MRITHLIADIYQLRTTMSGELKERCVMVSTNTIEKENTYLTMVTDGSRQIYIEEVH